MKRKGFYHGVFYVLITDYPCLPPWVTFIYPFIIYFFGVKIVDRVELSSQTALPRKYLPFLPDTDSHTDPQGYVFMCSLYSTYYWIGVEGNNPSYNEGQ